MKIYGLTGGIASGKSTISKMLQALGEHVIDADLLAREVVELGTPGLAQVLEAFPNAKGPDGRLIVPRCAPNGDWYFPEHKEHVN